MKANDKNMEYPIPTHLKHLLKVDMSKSDGSQVFFDDWGKELIDIKVLAKYISSNSCKMLEKLIQKQYLEFDEWIAENQWIFNDELSDIVRSYFGV